MVEYIVEYGALEIVKHFLSTAFSFAIVEYEVLFIVAFFFLDDRAAVMKLGLLIALP